MTSTDLARVVTLPEATTFQFAALRERWFDPERAGVVLVGAVAVLLAGLLVALKPVSICTDVKDLDPARLCPHISNIYYHGKIHVLVSPID